MGYVVHMQGVTQITHHVCSCMEWFEPRNPDEWSASEWSSGCRHRAPLNCPNGDGFRPFSKVKLPDTRRAWYNKSMTLSECETACKRNCSCTTYTNIDITTGNGCLMWFDELLDVRTVDECQDLYIRMVVSDLTSKFTRTYSLFLFIFYRCILLVNL